MSKNRQRARSISQAQKKRQQAKPSPSSGWTAEVEEAQALGRRPTEKPTRSAGIGGESADSEAVRQSGHRSNLERKVTIRLDAKRYDELDAYARREGFTVSLVVRHLLCRFLEEQRRYPGGLVK